MSVIKTAQGSFLTKPDDGTQGKYYSYMCYGHGLELCFEPRFFRTLWGSFYPGDRIRMMEMSGSNKDDTRQNILKSFCDAIVISVLGGEVDVRMVGEIVRFQMQPIVEKEVVVEPDLEYITDDGAEVKWFVGTRKFRVMLEGHVLAEVDTKEEAHAIASGGQPLPPLKEEA